MGNQPIFCIRWKSFNDNNKDQWSKYQPYTICTTDIVQIAQKGKTMRYCIDENGNKMVEYQYQNMQIS